MRCEYNLQKPDFTVGNIDILEVSRGKDYKNSYRNGRTKHGFLYMVKGSICHTFLDSSLGDVHLSAGELMFIPKGCTYHSTYLEDDNQVKIIQFDISSGVLPAYLMQPRMIGLPDAGECMEPFFKSLGNHVFYHLSCLYELLWRIDEVCAKPPVKYRKLQPALRAITEHPESNEKIACYAQLCGMSEVNFRRLFREYTGKSPIEHRNDIRLSDARIKLQSGEYNVSEAAQATGFSNLSFFIRLYKKKYGYTPKQE